MSRMSARRAMTADNPEHRQQVHALYRDHHGWLQQWLGRRLGNGSDAADLAQDTFTRILASRLPALLHEPRAYLTTVAHGILVNWYQRRDLERAYQEALAALPEDLAPSPEHQLIILQTLLEIDAMLSALPAPVRRAFLLSQVEGMKYEDIAAQLGVSLVTVKRYMARAFRQCLECLA